MRLVKRREVKRITKILKEQYAITLKKDYLFFMNSEGKIFLINREYPKQIEQKIRINSAGLYVGKIEKQSIRLTIEGSQLFHPEKKVVEILTEKETEWLKGKDLNISTPYTGFVILKCGDDFLGTGLYKNGKILNYIPKERRIMIHEE